MTTEQKTGAQLIGAEAQYLRDRSERPDTLRLACIADSLRELGELFAQNTGPGAAAGARIAAVLVELCGDVLCQVDAGAFTGGDTGDRLAGEQTVPTAILWDDVTYLGDVWARVGRRCWELAADAMADVRNVGDYIVTRWEAGE